MDWKRIAQVRFEQLGLKFGLVSHVSNPVAYYIGKNIYRIFFSARDNQHRAKICSFDYDLINQQVVADSCKLVLDLGEKGAFDDNGLSMGCLLSTNNGIFLYYLGWNLASTVPFRNSIGLAIAKDIYSPFEKVSKGPILDRNIIDPLSLSYPFVMLDKGLYRMWYGSHKKWGQGVDDMIHVMKHAESRDGINWERVGRICLDTTKDIHAYSKPSLILENNIYQMWYSYRGSKYRIGYAESEDGLTWNQYHNKSMLLPSKSGWDSEMLEYPYIFTHANNKYMLYNGNAYGESGMGIAVYNK